MLWRCVSCFVGVISSPYGQDGSERLRWAFPCLVFFSLPPSLGTAKHPSPRHPSLPPTTLQDVLSFRLLHRAEPIVQPTPMLPKSSTACISALTFNINIFCSSFNWPKLPPSTASTEQISFIRSTAFLRSPSVSGKKDSTGSLESRTFWRLLGCSSCEPASGSVHMGAWMEGCYRHVRMPRTPDWNPPD